jgi:hypothetical protein
VRLLPIFFEATGIAQGVPAPLCGLLRHFGNNCTENTFLGSCTRQRPDGGEWRLPSGGTDCQQNDLARPILQHALARHAHRRRHQLDAVAPALAPHAVLMAGRGDDDEPLGGIGAEVGVGGGKLAHDRDDVRDVLRRRERLSLQYEPVPRDAAFGQVVCHDIALGDVIGERVAAREHKPHVRVRVPHLIRQVDSLGHETDTLLRASLIKDTMRRKRPQFSERTYGYRSFTDLLKEAADLGLIRIHTDERSGTAVVDGFVD